MLAPIDKLRTRVNDIIQIVVTTACTLQCSNCTQLLPFRRDYRHMSLECFRLAVESLKDWPGVIGIFGGNPCNHPDFPQLCEILSDIIPDQRRRGLWSNDLLKYGDIAAKTFYPSGRFNLNAHGVTVAAEEIKLKLPGRLIPGSDARQAEHAAILADYHDFNLSPAEWEAARESCDINQKWSAAIVERFVSEENAGRPFAYFCEVAAAIDGVRGENHGIPAVPGWWQETMANEGFQRQVSQCCDRGCGVPLKIQGHRDNEKVYDISPSWESELPGQKQVAIQSHTEVPGTVKETTDYLRFRS